MKTKANRLSRQFVAANYAAQLALAAATPIPGMGTYTARRLTRAQAQRLVHRGERPDWMV